MEKRIRACDIKSQIHFEGSVDCEAFKSNPFAKVSRYLVLMLLFCFIAYYDPLLTTELFYNATVWKYR